MNAEIVDNYYDWYINFWADQVRSKKCEPQKILKEQNAEIRMDMIKACGLESLLDGLDHKVLDTMGDYQLLGIKINQTSCSFLKMVNPTTGSIHIEGVANEAKTVKDAIAWRIGAQNFVKPKAGT